jgi:hypothetical protein
MSRAGTNCPSSVIDGCSLSIHRVTLRIFAIRKVEISAYTEIKQVRKLRKVRPSSGTLGPGQLAHSYLGSSYCLPKERFLDRPFPVDPRAFARRTTTSGSISGHPAATSHWETGDSVNQPVLMRKDGQTRLCSRLAAHPGAASPRIPNRAGTAADARGD